LSEKNNKYSQDPYVRLTRREIYRNPWLSVEHHDIVHPGGHAGEHVAIVAQRPSGVVVLNADDEFVFTRQPRFAAGRYVLEIVKGGASEEESPLEAAQRELAEELGYIARSWVPLGAVYELPSLMQDPVTLFFAHELESTSQNLEETEAIDPVRLSREEAVEQALSGEITDAVTGIAILRANARIKRARL
jgi:8-oxo-dGTP pyrophosphatase MutT (NUDIX family)